jgi:hypothetical protein
MATAAGVWRELHPGRFVSGEDGAAAEVGRARRPRDGASGGWRRGTPPGWAALNQGSFALRD